MSESHSITASTQRKDKPDRPEGSPLFWNATGRWAKKIRGKLHYFGRGSHDDALAAYNAVATDLHAGRQPRDGEDALTVYQLCAKFLTAKKEQRDNGELAPCTFDEYGQVCKRLIRVLGRGRLVSDLQPEDFGKLRADMAKRWGVVRLKAEIVRSRLPFNWAMKNGLLKTPAVFGTAFSVPTAKTLRVHRAKQGPKLFEAEEIRRMVGAAGPGLKAMILLGMNCGFGNADVGGLRLAALDLDGGWVNSARQKTGIARRCPLWPETVAALREWLAVRPEPKNPDHAELVFITRERGAWLNVGSHRALSHEMRKLLDGLGINGHRNFYALRHTTQTVGDESGDFLAVRAIMGHIDSRDIANAYRERMSDERLRKVTDHVRGWLFAEPTPGPAPLR